MKDYYQILEAPVEASQPEIKEQYHFLMHAWHPDKFPNPCEKLKAHEKTQEINEAFAVLGDPLKREKYNRERLKNRMGMGGGQAAASPKNPEKFGWLSRFDPTRHYFTRQDPGFCPTDWKEVDTPEVKKHWEEQDFKIEVFRSGKLVVESYPQIVSDVLLSTTVHFQPHTDEKGEAGIAFAIEYQKYHPARFFRFGIARNGRWKFSRSEHAPADERGTRGPGGHTGENIIATDLSQPALELISRKESIQLDVACLDNRVMLAIERTCVCGPLSMEQPLCGESGIFVCSPENAFFAGASFSHFCPYFIRVL